MADIAEGLGRYRTAALFGWQDILQRYRRSRVGAFWLTINMAILIGALGVIFSALFDTPLGEYLPHIAVGLILWNFVSSSINDGSRCFIYAQPMILQVRMPLFTHVLRLVWRDTIILGHNLLILPFVLVFSALNPGWTVLLAPLGFALLVANLLWITLVLGTVCARYRDLPQIVQNLLQVAFYATPIMWQEQRLPPELALYLLNLNPFHHLLVVVRAPLLGEVPGALSYTVVTVAALAGWALALQIFGRYRWRIPYWL